MSEGSASGVSASSEVEVDFSRPYRSPDELVNLEAVLASDHAHGDGPFTKRATDKLTAIMGAPHALLTTSCTHGLEMTALLLDLAPGDEVVLPSFTFPSAATAVVSRGATPVFVDLDPATGNIDATQVAEAVTAQTRAVMVMHYGGVPVALDEILSITDAAGIALVEDNAHGLGTPGLGTRGAFATQSFHDTKNVHCGEGGALVINDARFLERAEIIREKGTNRARFLRGQVDKYTWVDAGSSYLLSEFGAAVLDAQLAAFDTIQQLRRSVWNAYAAGLSNWAGEHDIRLMSDRAGLEHAAHLYYLVMPDNAGQSALIEHLKQHGVRAAFQYVPLDSSPAGRRYGRTVGGRELSRSHDFSTRLVRLPLWAGMSDSQVERVIAAVTSYGN